MIGSEVERVLHILRPCDFALRFELRPRFRDRIKFDDARFRGLAAGDREALAIPRKHKRGHATRLAAEVREDFALCRINDGDVAMRPGGEEFAVGVKCKRADGRRRCRERWSGDEDQCDGELAEHGRVG